MSVDRREYSEDERRAIVERVCERIAEGGIGNTVKAASEAEGVTRGQIFRWARADKDLTALYDAARIAQAHSMGEDTIELADSATGGKNGDVDKVRLQVDTRKWYTSKIAPRIFGEKLELAGPDGIPLIPIAPTRTDLSKLSLEQLEQLHAILAVATIVVDLDAPAEPVRAALPATAGT